MSTIPDRYEWPPLPALKGARSVHVDSRQWLQHPSPPELRKVPISVPFAVATMTRDSIERERHLKRQGSQIYDSPMHESTSTSTAVE